MDWRICSKIPEVSGVVAATMDIRATRSISELTSVLNTRLFMATQRKKINGDKSGDLGGQMTGTACQILFVSKYPVQMVKNKSSVTRWSSYLLKLHVASSRCGTICKDCMHIEILSRSNEFVEEMLYIFSIGPTCGFFIVERKGMHKESGDKQINPTRRKNSSSAGRPSVSCKTH